jgi:hypothetical protein
LEPQQLHQLLLLLCEAHLIGSLVGTSQALLPIAKILLCMPSWLQVLQ